MRSSTNPVNDNDDVVSYKYNIGGDDVAYVEEYEMRSSTDSLNYNNDLVRGFDAYTCSGDNLYDIFDNQD